MKSKMSKSSKLIMNVENYSAIVVHIIYIQSWKLCGFFEFDVVSTNNKSWYSGCI